MRRRVKQEEDASKSLLGLIKIMREELEFFRSQIGKSRWSNEELERQKLLQRQQEQKWRQTMDIFKGITWLAKMADKSTTEDNEEDCNI